MLIREGADVWTLGRIYVAVVQEVLFYRLETWVMTPNIGGGLGIILPQCVPQAYGTETLEGKVQEVVVSSAGGSDR